MSESAKEREYQAFVNYINELKKDGTYKLIRFEENDAVPMALLTLHGLLKKKRRVRK